MNPLLGIAIPYYGGKGKIAKEVWKRFGSPDHYFEPFIGAGACLLKRPDWKGKSEYIGDTYCMIENLWRALRFGSPRRLAKLVDYPPSQMHLDACNSYLIGQKPYLHRELSADKDWYDEPCAAAYAWKVCNRISINAPGHSLNLGSARGVCRKRQDPVEYLTQMKKRLSMVTIFYGTWLRLAKRAESVSRYHDTACLMDPPYKYVTPSGKGRRPGLYVHDSGSIAYWVQQWCVAAARERPRLKIALCGLVGEHRMPKSWEAVAWKTRRGSDECVWFSPNCIEVETAKKK